MHSWSTEIGRYWLRIMPLVSFATLVVMPSISCALVVQIRLNGKLHPYK